MYIDLTRNEPEYAEDEPKLSIMALPKSLLFEFRYTGVLVLMHPSYPIEPSDHSNIGWEPIFIWPFEIWVENRNDILIVLHCARYLSMDPVVTVLVVQAPVKGLRSQHQDKMFRGLNVPQETTVELAGVEAIDIYEDLKSLLSEQISKWNPQQSLPCIPEAVAILSIDWPIGCRYSSGS